MTATSLVSQIMMMMMIIIIIIRLPGRVRAGTTVTYYREDSDSEPLGHSLPVARGKLIRLTAGAVVTQGSMWWRQLHWRVWPTRTGPGLPVPHGASELGPPARAGLGP